MGEASRGRSATSPTFFKSTSVRTRIEWQNSQVVWTALDQRNFTGAPQLGQFATGELMADRVVPVGALTRLRLRIPASATRRNLPPDAAGSKRYSGKASRIQGTYDRPSAIR